VSDGAREKNSPWATAEGRNRARSKKKKNNLVIKAINHY